MTSRTVVALVLFGCVLSAASAVAQPKDRHLDMKARVLDILFPMDVAPKSYFLKMTLRFGDSDTQLVVVIYPDKGKYWVRRCEITRYALAGMGEGQLSQLISRMVAENPDVREQEIAAKLKVEVTRSPIDYEALDRALKDLKAVRISPILASRVAVDEYSEYEYWYDGGQESVHYVITGPFKGDPQDQLVQWMIRFRANLPEMLKTPAVQNGSKLRSAPREQKPPDLGAATRADAPGPLRSDVAAARPTQIGRLCPHTFRAVSPARLFRRASFALSRDPAPISTA
jgi:hypothetical protein